MNNLPDKLPDKIPKIGYCIITRSGCRYCDMLEDLLFEQNIAYVKYNILDFSDEEVEQIKNTYKFKTMPIFIHNRYYIGGYNEASNILHR